MTRPAVLAVCLILLGMAGARSASAHPHAWIDYKVRVLFDNAGRIAALEETWLFDKSYSLFVTDGSDRDGDGKPDQAALDAVMKENMQNLLAYAYFTVVQSGETPVKTLAADEMSTRMDGERLELKFRLPLETPIGARDMPLRYAIFDPTYYVEMLHVQGGHSVQLVDAPAGCTSKIVPPNPNPDSVMLAASLDRTMSAGNGLGRLFAEEGQIRCD